MSELQPRIVSKIGRAQNRSARVLIESNAVVLHRIPSSVLKIRSELRHVVAEPSNAAHPADAVKIVVDRPPIRVRETLQLAREIIGVTNRVGTVEAVDDTCLRIHPQQLVVLIARAAGTIKH